MRTIDKDIGSAPLCLDKQPPNQKWDDFIGSECHQEVHRHLRAEQHGLCCYCECELQEKECHIEHLAPRKAAPERTYDYSNLAISCNDRNHCGHYKDWKKSPCHWDAQKFSSPHDPKTVCMFSYSVVDGKIEAAGPDIARAQYLIDYLGLNYPKLTERRKAHANVIVDTLGESPDIATIDFCLEHYLWPDQTGQCKRFPSLSKAILERIFQNLDFTPTSLNH